MNAGDGDSPKARRSPIGRWARAVPRPLLRFWHSLSTIGVLLGTLFFAFSLTPSLLPRTFLIQGILSGTSAAVGYALGVFRLWLWDALRLPPIRGRRRRIVKLIAVILCAGTAALFLYRAAEWQNSIRALMGIEPVPSIAPLMTGLVAAATFALLVGIARLFVRTCRWLSARAARRLPPRTARVIGVIAAVLLFWGVVSGILLRGALHLADSSYRQFDALIEPEFGRPVSPLKTGSAASLIGWEGLGRAGREFVGSGPTAMVIAEFTGVSAREPIRVYAGLRSADSARARAELALAELERVGGFDRSILIVAVPTGTGWIDSAALDTVEFLHGGDVASVAIQYSYLSSPLSLFVEPEYGDEAARALLNAVYRHWSSLPPARRPRLYLHGLSLGAFNSERSVAWHAMMRDPIQGALWSGPPFASRGWRSTTDARNPGSPAWLPQVGEGSRVRFANQAGVSSPSRARWGPTRIVYLQYASDPVTFFDTRCLYRAPDWMAAPRGPDVSPHLRWYPVVTCLQLLADMAIFTSAPSGHGHNYDAAHYIDAWIEVTEVKGWSPGKVARLKRVFAERRRG
jgi:uncharacterized membrane protein